jgi:hypothetical protein
VSELVDTESFPDVLSFVAQPVEQILNKLHYKNLQYSKAANGAGAHYSLDIVTGKRIELELPFGMSLVLNPDFSGGNSNISSFPISIDYKWEILSYLKSFNSSGFSFTPEAFYQIGIKLFKLDDVKILSASLDKLISNPSTNETKFDTIITDINTYYGFNQAAGTLLSLPTSQPQTLNLLITAIKQHPFINDSIPELVFKVYIANSNLNSARHKLNRFYEGILPEGIERFIKRIIKPQFRGVLTLSAALEFPRNILKPVYDQNGNSSYGGTTGSPFSVIPADANGYPKAMLKFAEAEFYADTEQGLGYSLDVALTLSHPVQIGNTPLILFIQNLKLDLSRKKNIAEADYDGRPADFMGVYVQEALIGFHPSWKHQNSSTAVIKGKNLLIGTGGISGAVTLERIHQTGEPTALFKLGNDTGGQHFELGLTTFSMLFKQGSIVESDIQGYLKIPGMKMNNGNPAIINILAHIGNNGDLKITASRQDQNIVDWNFEDIFKLSLCSISVGMQGGRWYIEASGKLTITANIPGLGTQLSDQPIDLKQIRIWQDGKIEFGAGGIQLPVIRTIKFGPVELKIDHLSFTNKEEWYRDQTQASTGVGKMRPYSIIGFSGGLNTGPGGVNVRGDGIEFHYSTDGDSAQYPKHRYLKIGGIGVEIKIPGTASEKDADVYIKGYLGMRMGNNANAVATQPNQTPETSPGKEYEGSVKFSIKKLHVAGSAAMRMKPNVPAWIVDIALDIPVPIPLGGTGLGIYGFRGLIGSHYVASKQYIGLKEDDMWYDYLKKKVAPRNKMGIGIEKFDPDKKGFSLGIGASIGTMGDNGWTFGSKVFVMLSSPEMLLIEGQASALQKRLGVEDEHDPPFYAYLVLDKNSIQAGLGVNYKLPSESGSILALKGEMQLGFFFNNSSAWYLNIGKDLPEEKRVQARLFSLFDAYAYLMVNSRGIKAGAGAKFKAEARFGPAAVGLYAFLDTSGFISFKPVQIGGAIQLGGGLYIRVGRFKIEIHVAAGLSAEAPKPFIISGYLEVRIKIVIFKIRIRLQFTWVITRALNTDEFKILDGQDFIANGGEAAKLPVKARHMLSEEAFSIKCQEGSIASLAASAITDEYIIPVDSYVDLEFKHPVRPYTNRFGGGVSPAPQYDVFVAPQKAASPQVKHHLIVEDIKLFIYDPQQQQWKPYDVWQPLIQAFQDAQLIVNTGNYPIGYWQYNNSPGKYSSLRLLAQTPLSVSSSTPVENFGLLSSHLFCEGVQRTMICQNWTAESLERSYPVEEIFRDRKLLLRFSKQGGYIADIANAFGAGKSLAIKADQKVEVFLNEPVLQVQVKLTSFNYGYVFFYSKVYDGGETLAGLHSYHYELVHKAYINYKHSFDVLRFEFKQAVSKIEFVAGSCGKSFTIIRELTPQWVDLAETGGFGEADQVKLMNWASREGELKDISHSAKEGLLPQWQAVSESSERLRPYTRRWVRTYEEEGPDAMMLYDVGSEWQHLYDGTAGEILSEEEKAIVGSWREAYLPALEPYRELAGSYCGEWLNEISDVEAPLRENALQWRGTYCENNPDKCSLYIHEICWLTEVDFQYNQVISSSPQSAITTGVNSLTQAVNEALPPIWRPNSVFGIEVSTRDEVYVGSGLHQANPAKYVFGFKTAGSLGFFHQKHKAYNDLLLENRTEQYQLANLRHYIDYERSYPDASGALINAKPLYYKNPKLSLFFNKPYCYELFTRWAAYQGNEAVDYELWAYIKDPVDTDTASNAILPKKIGWDIHKGQQSIPVNSLETETFSNILQSDNEHNCTLIHTVLKPPTASASKIFELLKPGKNYTALFKAKEKKASAAEKESVVHSYPFVTSKYESFRQHVKSYQRTVVTNKETGMTQPVNAIHRIWRNSGAITTLVADFQKIIDNTHGANDALLTGYASKYDRVVNGLLKIESMQAVTDTEITIIRRVEAGHMRVLGVLVRTAEPLNDPRLPADQLVRTVEVNDLISGSRSFEVIYSKDLSCIFISTRDLKMERRRHEIVLKYVRFDGKSYTIDETANSEDVVRFRLYLDRV